MNGIPAPLAVAVGLFLLWTLGGLALRLGGALAFWAGLIGLLTASDLDGAVVALVGVLAWVAGQAHHALRHGGVRGPTARALIGLGLIDVRHRGADRVRETFAKEGDRRQTWRPRSLG